MAASEGGGSLKTKHAAICDGKEEIPRAWIRWKIRRSFSMAEADTFFAIVVDSMFNERSRQEMR
ncbi:hypothetical protein E2C01_061966 [Portunus trituberculatus]|uniref:Uncharacterized protein n=1 Tax=Portunus trituberculatus TaxID=210409 RepID=A0A5B7H9Q0_PORTR|nr:hypothetical protein [Portunus trituberculatus]